MANIHEGHRHRIKDEFRANGLDHFSHHKILELMLFYAIPRRDTNELGHRLMERFGSFSSVLDAPYELLCEVPGLSQEAATYLKIMSSVMRVYLDDVSSHNNCITDTASAKLFMKNKFWGESVECLYFAGIGNNGRILFCDKLSEGSPETVSISPAAVIKAALRANANKVVLAHNHPHGMCNPTGADVRTTGVLYHELARIGVELMDHIIVAPDDTCSMRELGMLPKQ